MEFIILKSFDNSFSKSKLTDDDLRTIQNEIIKNPNAGDVEPGVKGVRKLRYASNRDKGKSSGARVHYIVLNDVCYLFAFVPKNVSENLSKEDRNNLAKLMSNLKKLQELFNDRGLFEMSGRTYYDYLNEGLNDLYDYLKGDKSKGRKLSMQSPELIRSEDMKLRIKESRDFDRYDPNVEAQFMEPGNLYNDMPDEPYDTDITSKNYFNFVVNDVMNRCKDEREARRYMTRNGLPKSFIDDVIEEIDRIYNND